MKHLLTAIACCLAVAGSAQAPNPDWNPDYNADSLVGSSDLLGLLSAFGFPFIGGEQVINKQYCTDTDTCEVLETTNYLVLETVEGTFEYNHINLPNDASWKVLLIETDKRQWSVLFDDIASPVNQNGQFVGFSWNWNTMPANSGEFPSEPRKRVLRLLRNDLGEWMPMH